MSDNISFIECGNSCIYYLSEMKIRYIKEGTKVIVGIGLDVTDIHRIEKACSRKSTFAGRVLTVAEETIFLELHGKRQMEFLAGRYAAKEALAKAMGTGIGKIGFHDIEILSDKSGKPVVTQSPFSGKVFLSISHTDSIAAAQVVLEAID